MLCGALQLLIFLGYSYLAALVIAQGYEWISASSGVLDIYLRSVLSGCALFLFLFTVPILAKVDPDRSMEASADPHLEPGVCPLLDRQDVSPIQPSRPAVRRVAALLALSQGAGREGRARRRDLLPERTHLHRPAHHRRRHGHPQGLLHQRLPSPCRFYPDRRRQPRQKRVRWRAHGDRHRKLDGRQ